MYLARTPALVKPLLKEFTWSMPSTGKDLYLTFDDGPTPDVTPWVLDTLAERGALATFFVLGRNAAAEPMLMERIRNEGHALGNHTWDHPNGWRTPFFTYLRSVVRCAAEVDTALFRPPYGRISRQQSRAVRNRYELVMWDVLSADFDTGLSGDQCTLNVTRNAVPGSIIVFHDSVKAEPRLRIALPQALAHFADLGYRFKKLEAQEIRAART